jgi:hypothetical protein
MVTFLLLKQEPQECGPGHVATKRIRSKLKSEENATSQV